MSAIGGVDLAHDAISAEIGEVLASLKAGRQNENEITIYGMVGLPCEDVATAWLIYNQAVASDVGTSMTLSD